MLSFTERMEAGRDVAHARRAKGLHTGSSKWRTISTAERYRDTDVKSWEWLCQEARRDWRNECITIRNDFAAACLNGPGWEADLAEFGGMH